MLARWIALVVLCLLARGWALAHAAQPLPPAAVRASVEAGPQGGPAGPTAPGAQGAAGGGQGASAHAGHDRHHGQACDDSAVAADGHETPDCRIACELGHAPALAGLWLPLAAPDWPAARPLGWHALHGVGPWPPEVPPPARG